MDAGRASTDRRRTQRLALELPVRYCARAPNGARRQGQGITVDVSTGGLRFETAADDAPEPPCRIAVHVTIPGRGEGARGSVCVSGQAIVLRRVALDAATGHHTGARAAIAVRFDEHPAISLPVLESSPIRRS